MSLTWLWTDIMIWGLVIALAIWGRVISQSPQVKKQWVQVFASKVAMVSAIVLVFYVLIALLDSLHFILDDASGTHSLLDLLLVHLAQNAERTYSAPFALVEYNRSMQVLESGEVVMQQLPLMHVNGEVSIALHSLWSWLASSAMTAVLVAGHLIWRAKHHRQPLFSYASQVWRGETVLPWKTAYFAVWLVLGVLVWFYWLSHHYHVLGTDKVGGDVLYESLKSIRTGVLIGVLTTLVMLPVALLLGISAGLFKGWVDDVIQYLYTTLNSIPGVLLIAAAVLMMQVLMSNHPEWFATTEERADVRLLFLVLILGMTSWTGLCRLLRAETLKISQVEYVTSARAFGVSRMRIIGRHILPNVMHIVLIAVVLDFSGLVLAEAVLSYVGVGVDPTMHSWGNMINQARLEMAREPMVWWSLLAAFLFMFVLVLAANLFSDRVQWVLNPKSHK
ncbi:ABC transporter permease [Thiomicrorhabdus sp. zzn3]|uniref:ABC transporter permease n=1 Tax=Thiomicrorhabdus sp. zzn3 TaxID=3039775 RepID=UPI0024363FD9|nr:ABC transporter permease [Thiomicrorhabdus sp. zzn3]MDG6778085.1 ABC transporter permease [Thiomicrorhabdus sp. zzn3]